MLTVYTFLTSRLQFDQGCRIAIGLDERSVGMSASLLLPLQPCLYFGTLSLRIRKFSCNPTLSSRYGIAGHLSHAQLVTLVTFSLLRPRDKRVYAPKIKYHQAVDQQKRASQMNFPRQQGHIRDHSTGMMGNPNEAGYESKFGPGSKADYSRDKEDLSGAIEDPYADAAPPPAIKNGFFSWFSPVLHTHEEAMLEQIGELQVSYIDRLTHLLTREFLDYL
jgi:hypothetical protein